MEIKESLIRTVLIGTDRVAIDSNIYAYVNEKIGEQERSNEQVVLEAIAIHHQLEQINPEVGYFDGKLEERLEERIVCPERFTLFLQEIIEEGAMLALPEFLEYISDKNWNIPPEYLPQLFDHCLKNEHLFQLISPVFGKTAKWLINQNPEWYPLSRGITTAKWALLTPSQKRFAITQLAREKPEEIFVFVQKHWDGATAQEQEIFLTALPLHPMTIPILEQAKSSSRKKIRKIAATKLVSIHGSAENDFLVSFLPHLLKKEGKTYSWQLPEDFLEATRTLNIPLEMEKNIHRTMKGAWIGGLIEYLSPDIWSHQLKLPHQEIIAILLNSPHHHEIFFGLVKASILHHNEAWREALILYLWENRAFSFAQKTGQELLKDLPAALFDKIALKMTKESNQIPIDGLLYQLFKYNQTPWSPALSRLLLHRFKTNLEKSTYNDFANFNAYKMILKKGAYLTSLESTEAILEQWPEQSPSWIYWEAAVHRYKQVLERRREVMASIEKNEQ